MILRSIELQGWRSIANPCRLGPFAERLNVIHAPNGAGKSTVFEALRRGLFDGYKVTGEGIDRIRSWGRDLAPSVTIEFTHGGADYRVVKRFHSDRAAEVLRMENGIFVRHAEGEAADAAARAIFGGAKPGRGLSGEEHWGLAQILWAPQGRLASAELSGGLLQSIRGALDVQAADTASGEVELAIRARYLESFTESGKMRGGASAPAWLALDEELQRLRQERPALEQKLLDFEEGSRRIDDLRARCQRAAHDESAAAVQLENARVAGVQYRELLAEKERRVSEVARVQAEHAQLDSRLAQIRERRAELASREEEIARLAVQLPELVRQSTELTAAEEGAGAALNAARQQHEEIEELRAGVESAERFLHARTELQRSGEILAAIDAATAAHESAKSEFAKLVAPDAKTLKAIRTAVAKKVETAALLDASLITLSLVPENGGAIHVEAAEQTGERALSAGKRWEIKGAPEVVVRVPGFGTIKARGPAGSVESLRRDVQNAVGNLAELTRAFGTTHLAELEEMHDRLKQQTQNVALAEGALAAKLGARSRDEWLRDDAKLRRTVEIALAANPLWESVAPDPLALGVTLRVRQAATPAIRAAELARDDAQLKSAAARQSVALGQNNLQNAKTHLLSTRRQLDLLTADGLDDTARAAAIQRTALQWDAAGGALANAEEKLTAIPSDPAPLVQNLERQIAGIRESAGRCARDEMFEKGRLQTLAAGAPYRVLAELDETVARIEAEVARERAKTDAIKLLHETVARHRAQTLASVSAPVEARALAIVERVAGRRFSGLHLGPSFQLGHVSPVSHSDRVDLDNLSGGEQEQVHLAVRLALAQVLAAGERQLVVLDDVLIATDAARLTRILQLLVELSQRLQIVILTCHPERYLGIEAQLFDLEKIKSGEPLGGS